MSQGLRVAVTGAGGYLGRALVNALANRASAVEQLAPARTTEEVVR